jgi:hypothetical protein
LFVERYYHFNDYFGGKDKHIPPNSQKIEFIFVKKGAVMVFGCSLGWLPRRGQE